MSRSERLLDLLQILRGYRQPVSGQVLADRLGVSIRTLYRDIATLQGQGADIQGEPGLGYVLKPGFMLPPLMFTVDEIEALVLGARWVARRGDDRLGQAALSAQARIADVLPPALRDEMAASALLVGPGPGPVVVIDTAVVRAAIRAERKLIISYGDAAGALTERVIWPFAIGFFDRVQVVVAWCELRDGFRVFRIDRISACSETTTRYPRRRQVLLKAWQIERDIAPPP
ncbi:DeoR family transcriptional regulator [Tistrella bauzanensis]|uniref:DeoR family transcriptional regulator n=1 Tax=Tistrella bauzanensis TaxID=657419 RepID=A0ABQ1IK09_9PROT|nr:YafY family protein [Tistrella bauzanensis]GGB44414.1 DeoR family transcriptional regulator [Tistrella bauzanensis]